MKSNLQFESTENRTKQKILSSENNRGGKMSLSIPCQTPKLHALELSLTIGCRVDCLYCPQKLLLSKYYSADKNRKSTLSFDDFKKVLDKVERNSSISFAGMSEPFHNPYCADMIVYAYQQGYKISLLTTLVDMTMEDYQKIKDIPFESFVLHIPDEEQHSRFSITDEYLELLKQINKNIKIDYYSCHGNVHPVVKNLIDPEMYAGISLGNRAGNLDLEEVPVTAAKTGSIVCYHGSEKQIGGWAPVMFPDGTLVLCCQDYGMKHVLGNLLEESWEEIQAGKEFQHFIEGLTADSSDILCRTCCDSRNVEELPSMQIKRSVDMIKEQLNKDNYTASISSNFIWKLARCRHVCVFGLGKLFRDHFFQEYWHQGLNVSLLADNNQEMQGKYIEGLLCVSPEQLKEYPDVMVIIFVKDSDKIEQQLKNLGVMNYITIFQIIDEYNKEKQFVSKNLFLKRD